MRVVRRPLCPVAALVVLCAAAPAAALQQPNGTVIPTPAVYCNSGQPGGLGAIFACVCTTAVCNIGATCPGGSTSCDPGQNGTCETRIWHNVNDNSCIPSNLAGLDPQAEAAITPETFRPTCPLTFTVLSRGTAMFGNVFGWYNVTGSAPATSDLHVMLPCDAAAGTAVVLDLSTEPAWTGGDIGFFIITPESHTSGGACAGGNCCATVPRLAAGEGYAYYSQSAFNPDHAGASSFIHLITYNSHITARKFYFAWEDIYGGSDNEFTDLVTSVEGVDCSGAGEPCDTGLDGVCAYGVTTCDGGSLHCQQLYPSSAEKCDGVDNDCNGQVDDGATCPEAGQVCSGGRCVPHCTVGGEFDCPTGFTCDDATGLCAETACAGVDCNPGSVCRGGVCVGGCDGVVCPHGQSCILGACVNPCAFVTCSPGDACREGVCVPGCGQCGGIICGSGLSCDHDSGDCYDPSCATPCPALTYCDSGACVDVCTGAVCPGGEACQDGQCVVPAGAQDDGGTAAGDGGIPDGPGTGNDADLGGHLQPPAGGGCSCRAGAPGPGAPVLLLGAALAVVAVRRRRRPRS